MSEYKPVHKVKDNIYKKIFGETELFLEFLENFIPIDILKNIKPENVEDVTERFLPLFSDNQDSDTIKRINLENSPLFVISIIEHESEVNYTSSFKMLQYITLVLDDYIKENDKKYKKETEKNGETSLKSSKAKDFKYPPVLPIVFYDGASKWTSELNFFNKVEMNDIFAKYIPKFEYELVDLNIYSQQDLVDYQNALSLILIIDKVRRAEDIKNLKKLPMNYIEEMAKKIPEHFLKIFGDCIRLLLERANAPREEIETITEKIYERRLNNMFEFIDGYDIQATRKEAKEKGMAEGKKEGRKEGRQEAMKEFEAKEKEYESEIKKLREELNKYKMAERN